MELNELLNIFINKNLIDIIISNPKKKDAAAKIKIRPVEIRGGVEYQATSYAGNQVFHKNYQENILRDKLKAWITDDYKQGQFLGNGYEATVLSGKKGNLTIKCKKKDNTNTGRIQAPLKHNREKKYILEEGKPVGFMIDLGVMTSEGRIVNSRYDKYRQINRFLEFIEDVLPALDKDKEQTIIDFGCGKSYLTFAMYYYLKILKGYDVRIIGLDLKKDVIEHCNRLAEKYGYDKLKFFVGDIASYNEVSSVDMVVTLHACDTATDYALYKAVKWGAGVILSVPCCQHEANAQIENEDLYGILRYGILKERMAAIITDGIRANILEDCGYKTQILEFIDIENTPKNLLIRAIKDKSDKNNRDKDNGNKNGRNIAEGLQEYFSLDLTLGRLIREE